MRVTMLNPGQPIAEGDRAPIDREWFSWIRRLVDALGFTPTTPIYADLPYAITNSIGLVETAIGGMNAPCNPDGSSTGIRWRAFLPNNYRNGTPIKAFALMTPVDGTAGNVRMQLRHTAAPEGGTFPTSTDELQTIAASGVDDTQGQTNFTDIPGSGRAKGDVIIGQLNRVGADAADTYGNSVLVALGLKYQIDGPGWETVHP